MSYQDLSEQERARVRAQFYDPETTQERRIDLIRMIQNSADEAKMGRQCPRCKHYPYFVPHDEALLEGHVYSDDGMAEIGITGYCEFCFDLITKEPDEDVDDDTLCLNCGEPLGVHVWSQAQASSLCPKGDTEFNPA